MSILETLFRVRKCKQHMSFTDIRLQLIHRKVFRGNLPQSQPILNGTAYQFTYIWWHRRWEIIKNYIQSKWAGCIETWAGEAQLSHGLDDQGTGAPLSLRKRIASLLHCVKIGVVTTQPRGRGWYWWLFNHGDKAVGEWVWPLTFIYFRASRESGAMPPTPYVFIVWELSTWALLQYINPLNTQRRPLYLKTQFVPL